MLSKVVRPKSGETFAAAQFPAVGPQIAPMSAPQTSDSGPLREKVRALEAEVASARREGFDTGRAQGEQQARAELQPIVERLNATLADLISLRPNLRRGAERDTVQLALLIARRVLHRELQVDENALNAIARVAFDRLARSESYTVTVHPRFANAIRDALPAAQASRVRIEPDPACAPGALVFHSSEGTIDASVETQLEEISRGLTDRLQLSS